jgi:NADPH:quinone reductase-like Zn-dependent oxidoreductase
MTIHTTPETTDQNGSGVPATMTAAVTRRYGTAEVVAIEQVPVPAPAEGEVLVKVEASSLNALDWHMLTGTPHLLRLAAGIRRPKRIIPGADVAGTVVAVGLGATVFQPGDAVFGECEGGGCAPYVTVDADHVVAKPEAVSFEAAGATPVAGLTALQGLRTHGAVQPGERVLINGAAGGVGTFAVQIAKALGAHVTGVCSTGNLDMVRSLGADEVVDYTTEDFVPGGARFDVMLDMVGNRSPKECLSVLLPDARFVAISGPKSNRWVDPLPHIARTALAFLRARQSFHQFTAGPNHDDLSFLGELLATGKVTPEIQRVIGLQGVADGLAEIGTGHTKAKIVVLPT